MTGLPFGPGAVVLTLGLIGFVALVAYTAWRQGPAFVLPVRDYLAVLVIVMLLFAIAVSMGGQNKEATDILLGALIAAFSAIVAFYFRNGNGKP
jgi:hypothetical protein